MVASRYTLDNFGNNDSDNQLTEFLKLCLGPAVCLNPRAINALKNSVSAQALFVLAKVNPDLLIRCLFPQAQLSESIIVFLKLSEIVIRSEEGIYAYEDGIPKISYEIKLGFLELFLLIYYGIYFRKPDPGNINSSSEWINLGEYFSDKYLLTGNLADTKYDIKIIPPRILDFSSILEILPQIALIAGSFQIAYLEPRLYPIDIGKHENLESRIQRAMSTLPQEVSSIIQTTNLKYSAFSQLNPNQFQSSSSISLYLIEVPDTKPDLVNDSYAVTNMIKEFAFEFEKLFLFSNGVVTISNPNLWDLTATSMSSSSSSIKNEDKILNTLFNLFCNISLLFLPKGNSLLESHAIYKCYLGHESPVKSSSPSGYWIASTLLSTGSYTLNEQIEKFLHTSLAIIKAGATSNWSYDRAKCEISANNWLSLFNCKVMREIVLPMLQNYQHYNEINQILESLPHQQSSYLLDNLIQMVNSPSDILEGIYIRKINFPSIPKYREMLSEELNRQASGLTSLLKVRSATRIINGIPLRLPGNNLQDCSGLVILASHGSLPIAAFKRQPSYSVFQNIKDHLFGFPTIVQKFPRQHSGKAILSHSDLYRSLVSIHLRYENRFYDLSRKSFLAQCFMRYAVKYFRNNLHIQSQMLSQEALAQIRLYISRELDCALNKNYASLHTYYMNLFELIVENAKANSCTLYVALNNYRQISLGNKAIHLNQNTTQHGSFRNPPNHDLLLSGNRSYQTMDVKLVYQANEAFLQGVRLLSLSQFRPDTFTCDMLTYKLDEFIHLNLLLRFGNIPAVYANVCRANGDINLQGIYEAILIQDYIFNYFGQSLSFLTYAEETGEIKIFTPEMFRMTYLTLPVQIDENLVANHVYHRLVNLNATINSASPLSSSTVTSLSSPPSLLRPVSNIPHSASAGALTEVTASPPVPSFSFDFSTPQPSTPVSSLYNQNMDPVHRTSSLASTVSMSSPLFRRQDAVHEIDSLQLPGPVPAAKKHRKKRNRSPTVFSTGIFNLFSQSSRTLADEGIQNINLPDTSLFTVSRQS